jgi:threonine dehydrogenase-like Zn-dependent dehydrogenase
MARAIDPAQILTRRVDLDDAIDAYRSFDRREEGWLKVELLPMQ